MNFDEIVVKESPGICRCCLSEGCYKDLGTEYTWMNETEVYADMLLDCFDIGITQHSDGPNGAKRLICEVCITRLRDACNFKKQVVESERRFIDMLGRGEFKTKVLTYQSPREMKEEVAEEAAEDVLAEDVEYLDDVDFHSQDEVIKTEVVQSTSAPSTSGKPRLKRGRPRKVDDKPDKKKQKVAKDRAKVEGRKRSRGIEVTTTYPKVKLEIDEYKPEDEQSNTEDDESNTEDEEFNVKDENKASKLKYKFTKPLQCRSARGNLICILNNSTAMPFSHRKSKFNCFICRESFLRCGMLQQHFKSEHATYKYTVIDNIIKKINKHTCLKVDIANLTCKRCQKQFADLKSLIDHLISEHNVEYDKKAINIVQPFKLVDDDLRCHICDEKFEYFIKLVTHLNDIHEDKKFMCDICGKSFKTMSLYNMHGWQVHGPGFSCTDCGKRCSTSALLREHKASTHGKNMFKCSECSAEFTSIYKRKKHIISVHKSIDVPSSFKCPHCKQVFTCTSQRNVHVRKIHLKEKNEVCPICHVELFNKTRLNVHMVKHLRERNHVCDLCGKKYQWKKNLKVHMRKTHNVL